MSNSVALDVAIGLIFIFLLYSLLATTIGEALATLLNIRGRIMLKSVERMLTDQFKSRDDASSWQNIRNAITDLYYSLFLRSGINYNQSLAKRFFNYPAIKYLTRGVMDKYPAYISCAMFSTTVIEILRLKGTASTIMQEIAMGIDMPRLHKDPETKRYLQDLVTKANGDVNAFKTSLELWFNETMDRASGWYKVRIQSLQFVIGLTLAMAININTFDLVKILSKDEGARDGLVKMATDPKRLERYRQTVKGNDTIDVAFQEAFKELHADSKEASKILGSGWHFEDSTKRCVGQTDVEQKWDFLKGIFIDQPKGTTAPHSAKTENDSIKIEKNENEFAGKTFALKPIDDKKLETLRTLTGTEFKKVDSIRFTRDTCSTGTAGKEATMLATVYGQRLYHIHEKAWFVIVETFTKPRNFFGFLITALALCLGAPFWFDLLNKFTTIRGGGKNPDAKKEVAEERNKETKFDSSKEKTNPQGHQLSEHMLTDPVRYALAVNDQYLRSIPGVTTLNRDFLISESNVKTPCIEVGIKPLCDKRLIPEEIVVMFEGKEKKIPVVIRLNEAAKLHSDEFKNKKFAIRNGFAPGGKKGWGTATGLVKLKGKHGRDVLLSCSHVLRGDNRLNEVNGTTDIHCCLGSESDPDPVVGKLLFQYQSRAFDVAWADFSLSVNAHTTSAFVKDLIKIKQPRGITDDDAAIELGVKMDGAVSGPVSGVVWNSSVEFEFDSDIGFVKMFDLLKLTIRGKDEKGKSVFKTLSKPGDSGSLVSDTKGNPVGMVIGGNEEYTYALKLAEVFKRFDEIQYHQTV